MVRIQKKCDVKSCATSKKGLRSQRLCPLRLSHINDSLRKQLMTQFKVTGEERACRKCRCMIESFIKSKKECPLSEVGTGVNDTLATPGRPRVKYTEASGATKRRVRAEARNLVNGVVAECNELSRGEGWQLLKDVTKDTPFQQSIRHE